MQIYNVDGFYYLILVEDNSEEPKYQIINDTTNYKINFYEHRLH